MGYVIPHTKSNFELHDMDRTVQPIRLLIFEDNDDMRESLSILFKGIPNIVFTGGFADCTHLAENIKATQPDVVLMDIDLPKVNGIEAVWQIKQSFPEIQVLMLTVFDDNDKIFKSICAGASGYILKRTSPSRIVDAIFEVAEGGGPMSAAIARKVLEMFPRNNPKENETEILSPREREVLALMVKGLSYKMVSRELDIALETVRSHIKKIYDKLHVHNSNEAVAIAVRKRLV